MIQGVVTPPVLGMDEGRMNFQYRPERTDFLPFLDSSSDARLCGQLLDDLHYMGVSLYPAPQQEPK